MHLAGLQQRAVWVSGGGHPSDQSGFVAPIFEGRFVRLVLTKVVKMQLLSISHVSVITFPSLVMVVLGRFVGFFHTRKLSFSRPTRPLNYGSLFRGRPRLQTQQDRLRTVLNAAAV